MSDYQLLRGIYDNDYFSGAQVALYIGDVWVDEVTSVGFQVVQNRMPIYGYASALFDDISKGTVMVQGQFSINFKEAGYLWLVLNHYKKMNGGKSKLTPIHSAEALGQTKGVTYLSSEYANAQNIEQITSDQGILPGILKQNSNDRLKALTEAYSLSVQANLAGFASTARSLDMRNENGKMIGAESSFEAFENLIWQQPNNESLDVGRRADDPDLNPFDIYITFGDYTGNDKIHHTIQKLEEVYILGNSKQMSIDGLPIQEVYQFLAKNLI